MSWLFTLVNPIIVGLAGSFLHRLVSHQVVVLGFTGRRSGRNFAIPVTYLRRDGEILCMTERNGIWWRNLQGAKPVQLTLDGRSVAAVPQVEVEDDQQVAAALDCSACAVASVRTLLGSDSMAMVSQRVRI